MHSKYSHLLISHYVNDILLGVAFYEVATHEVGHTLGLDHSEVPSAVMNSDHPSFGNPYFDLDPDDIAGIQARKFTIFDE